MVSAQELMVLLSPVIQGAGFVLEEIKVTTFGKRKLLSVIVDGEERNPNLDEIASVSRIISEKLDQDSPFGEQGFTLEVTTPGTDRPLSLPRHWKKNIGRLVDIKLKDAKQVSGRIQATKDGEIQIDENWISLDEIQIAKIKIEFNRKDLR